MRSYLSLSIRQKLQSIVMVTSAVALLVASIVFTLYDRSTFLLAKTQDLSASARMVGRNSTAALSFGDAESGREILAALQVKQNVINACIYSKDGTVFASYSRDTAYSNFSPPPVQTQATAIVGHNMLLFQPITLNGQSIGTIFIEADLMDLRERLTRFLEIDLLVFLVSLAVAFLVSTRLQRVISGPIRELADTASTVATQENFSIRATKRGNDEIGILFDQFNSMLDRLQQRDIALQRAHEKLKVDSFQITILSQMGGLLQTCRDIEEISRVIGQFAQQVFPGASGTLWAISESRNIVECVASWGGPPPPEQVFLPEDCWALRQGRLHLVETASGLVCKHRGAQGSFPSLCVPLIAHSETLGLLHIQSGTNESGSSNAPSHGQIESTKQFAIVMAGHIALALANLRLGDKLRNQSIRDALTGLFNRRYMEESLERELRRAVRNNQSVALLMLDIDHFKRVNDTFGHQAGDTLLRAFGEFLKQRTRGQDVVCRYGGEEFVLVLSGSSVDGACQLAEILRKEVRHLAVQHAGQVLGEINISIGVSAYPNQGATPEELLRAADQALYRAKSEGRDRVVVA